MKTSKELQKWLDNHQISKEEVVSVKRWLQSCEEYDSTLNIYFKEDGYTLQDVIDFVNSTSSQTDLNPLVAQFEKVEKEVAKLRKIINKL